MELTILMPALNEEKAIGKTIDSIPLKQLNDIGYEVEVLVVDGGSKDKTREIAKEKGALLVQSEKGYGLQYKVGFNKSSGDIIVSADSDGSYPLAEIPRLLEFFNKENLDFISTNRFAFMDKGSMRFLNKVGNKILTFFVNFLFSLSLKDSQSGMWIIRKKALEKIKLKSNGMALSQEIKIEAFTKLKAKEIDSTYKKRIGETKLKAFRDGWNNLYNLFEKRYLN